jgi:hypothetical protein
MTQDELNEVWEEAFRAGFYAGFAVSGEGWNAEYPFRDSEIDIKSHKGINHALQKAMERVSK